MLFFCHFAEFSKTTMENYGIFTTLRLYDYATTMENRRKNRAIQGDRPFFFQFLVKNRVDWKRIYKFGKF